MFVPNQDAVHNPLLAHPLTADDAGFRRLIEVSSVGVLVCDTSGYVTYMNSALQQLLGYSAGDIASRAIRWSDLSETTCAAQDAQADAELRATGRCAPYEKVYLTRDGQPVPALVSAVVLPDAHGRPALAAAFVTDLTQQKQAEEAVRRSEARYRSLVQATSLLVWMTAADGAFTAPNPPWELYTGQPWPDYQGYGWIAMLHPDDQVRIAAEWRQAIVTRSAFEMRGRVWQAAGTSYRHILARGAPVIDSDGQLCEWIGTMTDIHEQTLLEQEREQLLARERAARAHAEQSAARIVLLQGVASALAGALTPQQIAEIVNTQTCRAFEAQASFVALTRDEHLFELAHAVDFPESYVRPWQRFTIDQPLPATDALRNGAPVLISSPEELLARYPNLAPLRWSEFAARAAVPLMVEGRRHGVILLCFTAARGFSAEDVALMSALGQLCAQALERARLYEVEQQARADAENAVRVRDQFLSVASHELRTPLTALLGNAELVQRRALRDGGLSERNQRGLQIIVDQARQLNRMISTLLDLSRLQSGLFALAREPVNLCALVQRVVEEAQPLMDGHQVLVDLPAQPVAVTGDDLRLQQVLYNLVSNALKYSPAGSRVNLSVAQAGDQAVVQVQDQGIGIPAEALPQLFQRFYRAGNVQAQHVSGMGIGLYVVKEIVSLHGGTILVESTEGQGSTFTIRLPSPA